MLQRKIELEALLICVFLLCGCLCSVSRFQRVMGWSGSLNVAFSGHTHLLFIESLNQILLFVDLLLIFIKRKRT